MVRIITIQHNNMAQLSPSALLQGQIPNQAQPDPTSNNYGSQSWNDAVASDNAGASSAGGGESYSQGLEDDENKINPIQDYANIAGGMKNDLESMAAPFQDPNGSIGDRVKALLEGTGGLLAKSLTAIGEPFKVGVDAVSPLFSNMKSLQNATTGNGNISKALDGITGLEGKYSAFKTAHPELASNLENLLTIGMGVVGEGEPASEGQGKSGVNTKVPNIGEDAGGVIDNAKATVKNAVAGAKSSITPEPEAEPAEEDNFNKNVQEAKNILNPQNKMSVGQKGAAIGSGDVETQGKGIFQKAVATTPTTPMHETLGDMVDRGVISEDNWPHQNVQAMNQEAHVHEDNINDLIGREDLNVPVDKQTVMDKLDSAQAKGVASRQFVSGSTAERAYRDVFDLARQEVTSAPKSSVDLGQDMTMEPENSTDVRGLRGANKAFNGRAEDLLGNRIYGENDEGVGNARVQAAKDARKAFTDHIASTVEEAAPNKGAGSLFKSEIQKEAQILNARDQLIKNSSGDLGKSKAELYLDRHPGAKFTTRLGQRILWRTVAGTAARAITSGLKGL